MHATPDATSAAVAAHRELYSGILGRTGLHVSGAGFGGYRVSIGIEAHKRSLALALSSGINLIDTSANYADGGSEELIGETMLEMVRAGIVDRRGVVVVTKAGYMQGTNLQIARERLAAGGGFPEIVEYAHGLWHCIAPEFLEDQLTRSLSRLHMQSVDVLLLHNPEYYLGWASREGIRPDIANAEYYRRIEKAFRYLETEVERGRILWYGISSNSFPHESDSHELTSLEKVLEIAGGISSDHHFAVIQFPGNLREPGFMLERNQPSGATLIELARRNDLGVLVNRPLNAIVDGELHRLADFDLTGLPRSADEIDTAVAKLVGDEPGIAARIIADAQLDAERSTAVREFLTIAPTLQANWRQLGTIEQFNDVVTQHFAPRLTYVAQLLREQADDGLIAAFAEYVREVRDLFGMISDHYGRGAAERVARMRDVIAAATGTEPDGSFSSVAIRMLLGIDGVDCVLVGMRREGYVHDVLTALRRGPLASEKAWERLASAG